MDKDNQTKMIPVKNLLIFRGIFIVNRGFF